MPQCPSCGRELAVASDGSPFCPECQLAHQPSRRMPHGLVDYLQRFPVTCILIALNVLVYVAMVIGHVSPTWPTSAALVRWGADSGVDVIAHHQWWRILSAAFVHIGIVHLAMNMWALWVLGTLAEAVLGTYLYIGIYIAGAISASLASLFWRPTVVGAGASGAIIGILGALVSVLKFARLPLPEPVLRSTLRSLVQGAVLTLLIGVFGPIDNAAHIGGLICGLIIGFSLSWTRRADYGMQRPLRLACLVIPFLLMVPLAIGVQRRGEPQIQIRQAEQYLDTGAYPLAEHQAREALKRLPNDEEALETLSAALVYENKDQEAVKYFEEILARNPRNEFAANNLALAHLRRGDASAARDVLSRTLPLQARNAVGHVYLAQALRKLDQDDAAMTEYRRAIEMDPQIYDAQIGLAQLYEEHNKLGEAMLLYQAAAKLHPADPDPLRALARTLAAAGKNRQAEDVLARVQQMEKQREQQQKPAPGTSKPTT